MKDKINIDDFANQDAPGFKALETEVMHALNKALKRIRAEFFTFTTKTYPEYLKEGVIHALTISAAITLIVGMTTPDADDMRKDIVSRLADYVEGNTEQFYSMKMNEDN